MVFKRIQAFVSNAMAQANAEVDAEHTKMYVRELRRTFSDELSEHGCCNFTVEKSLKEAFPIDVPVPKLVAEFCQLMTAIPLGSLGWFQVSNTEKIDNCCPLMPT